MGQDAENGGARKTGSSKNRAARSTVKVEALAIVYQRFTRIPAKKSLETSLTLSKPSPR